MGIDFEVSRSRSTVPILDQDECIGRYGLFPEVVYAVYDKLGERLQRKCSLNFVSQSITFSKSEIP